MPRLRLMHVGICVTSEANMTPEGEIIVGEGAGVHEVRTEITRWDTRRDRVHSQVVRMARQGLTGRFELQSKNFREVTQDLRTIPCCSACSGTHLKLPFLALEVPVEIDGQKFTHSAICTIKRVEIFAMEAPDVKTACIS